ncbi:hypothetical protein ACH47C_23580 [Streptomyces rishiriensis]|uniref:hypothetical protein n=1 Tax=Streptomyces rishiriensis TaxID=68264 RepID=UPI0033CD9B93
MSRRTTGPAGAMRELGRRAFLEAEGAPEDELALIEQAHAQRCCQAATTEAASPRP